MTARRTRAPVSLCAGLALGAACLMAACSASPVPPELKEAERLERQGDHDRALAAYARATDTCQKISDADRRAARCGEAHLHRAELLERMGRKREAAEAYLEVPEAVDEPEAAGRATYHAGRIYLELGDDARSYELLWHAVIEYPNQLAAADAVKLLTDDGRRRAPRELYSVFRELWGALADTDIAAHLAFAMAELAEQELGDARAALELYDEISEAYPESGLYDEALWRGARLARELGDPDGALARYRQILATREELPFGFGATHSPHADDALLESARIHRDELGEYRRAVALFRELPERFPDSRLHDDAMFERGVTWARASEPRRACAALARLAARWPDSRYELERGPALRDELRCDER